MKKTANFTVDPRLAALLGETYRSSEQALKELVDNAWDAEADNVRITLPGHVTSEAIVIRDDGVGMDANELQDQYLLVAGNRRTRNGELTAIKKRKVKGRKGIGKFAGLMAADVMTLTASARGVATTIVIPKQEILSAPKDLEQIELPLTTAACNPSEHGVLITLTHLNQSLSYPDADTMRQLLMLEYGRETGFAIFVNDQLLSMEDLPGESFAEEVELPDVGIVRLRFKVAHGKQTLKNSGIALRIGGKIVGKPLYFGLDKEEDIPRKLLQKVYGEVETEWLPDGVTAGWDAVVENSKAFRAIEEWVLPLLRSGVKKVWHKEVSLAGARIMKKYYQRLAAMPEHRRKYAKIALERVMKRFNGESDARIATVANVVLDALERDEYWQVLKSIDDAKHGDVEKLAEALAEFGMVEIAIMVQHTMNRLRFLDSLEELVRNPDTHEITVHKALEKNLWIFGDEYTLLTSNKTLARTIDEYLGQKFTGERANKRPDLLLADISRDRQLLIEFKRPSELLTRDHKNQAEKYRDDLQSRFSKEIDILILGDKRKANLSADHEGGRVKLLSYVESISAARVRLEWLIKELSEV